MTESPFTGVSLAELGRRLRAGETDPVELLDRALAAIEAAQPGLNAFVTVDAQRARAAAVERRAEPAREVDPGPWAGTPEGRYGYRPGCGASAASGRPSVGSTPPGCSRCPGRWTRSARWPARSPTRGSAGAR